MENVGRGAGEQGWEADLKGKIEHTNLKLSRLLLRGVPRQAEVRVLHVVHGFVGQRAALCDWKWERGGKRL